MASTNTTTSTKSSFPVGSKVILHSLKNEDFNGKIGVIQSKLQSNERQQVLLIGSGETKILGIKPANLKYELRSVNSLSINELKTLLKLKKKEQGITDDNVTYLTGLDKVQLRELVKDEVPTEEEIADLLYTHLEKQREEKEIEEAKKQKDAKKKKTAFNATTTSKEQISNSLDNMTPEQMRSQAQMLRSMPPNQIRRMNPQMANLSDAQIQMAAHQMEMMANNPNMLNQMKTQLNQMTPEQLQQAQQQVQGNVTPGAAGIPGGAAPTSLADLSPEQLKQQVQMMKTMTCDQIRSMNPQMAGWSDSQVQMSISQMEMVSNNPDMMKNVQEQMKGMSPEEIQNLQKMASEGGSGASSPANFATQNPMEMLKKNPEQIKSMMKMLKENPKLMKDMLRSSGNSEMADKMTDEQLEQTIGLFANMDENKINGVLKMMEYFDKMKKSPTAKLAVVVALASIIYIVYFGFTNGFGSLFGSFFKSGGSSMKTTTLLETEEVPQVPVIEDEFEF